MTMTSGGGAAADIANLMATRDAMRDEVDDRVRLAGTALDVRYAEKPLSGSSSRR